MLYYTVPWYEGMEMLQESHPKDLWLSAWIAPKAAVSSCSLICHWQLSHGLSILYEPAAIAG